ncbi:MAG: hypothetical protein ACR2OG_06125 [Gemmatimonadaceae bacterium]
MAKIETRKETKGEAEAVSTPASDPSPLERMTELTRRIVNVPKSEVLPKEQRPKRLV